MISESQIRTIVADVLKHRFEGDDFVGSNVAIEEDFDGEKVVRVTARFQKNGVPATALFASSDEIRDRLLKSGDDRFVFIQQLVHDDPELEDLAPAERPRQ